MKKLTLNLKFLTNKGKFDVWIYAICIICLAMPYFMWQISVIPFLFICAIISLKNLGKKENLYLAVFMTMLSLYSGIFSSWSLMGIIFLLLLTSIFYAKPTFIKQSFDVYVYIFSIMLIPSILQHILVNMLGINMPHSVIKSLNDGKLGEYSHYMFMVTYTGGEITIDSILPRFYSYFDEPGVIGTIATVILYVKRYNLKSWINIPFFIAGILSFSLVFILLSIIYLFVFVKIKNRYKLMLIPLLVLLVLLSVNNQLLNYYILERLNLDSNFLASFMTRRDNGENFSYWYSNFVKSPQYFTGMGPGYNLTVNTGGSSYKNIIIDLGIIYFILYLGAFVLYGIRSLKFSRELLIALLILFSIIYQRPFIQDLSYVFLIYAPFIFLKEEKRESLLL